MNRDYWLDERARLQSILDDIEAGHIVLRNGEAEYLDVLRQRIVSLNEKIAGTTQGSANAAQSPRSTQSGRSTL